MCQLQNKEDFRKHFDVSRETIAMLDNYDAIIREFGSNTNIISHKSKMNIWCRHFADSAKLFAIIEGIAKRKKQEAISICDIGTGAGLPGIVLAILNTEKNENFSFTLVESNRKKFNILERIVFKLKLDITLENKRAEFLNKSFDIITARAPAPLKRILEFTQNITRPHTVFVLPKGKSWKDELEQIKNKWNYDVNVVKNNIMIDKTGGVTLILKKLKLK